MAHQKSELERELKRLALVQDQIDEVELTRIKILEESQSRCARVARRLMALVGVGPVGAWTLSYELFGWRKFRNRRQLGALVGMVGRPYNSGRMERDRGIGREGITRVRTLMVELGWLWLRHQKASRLTEWFNKKFGKGKRARKVGIVALGRRLLVSFWHYLEHGIVPDGARLRSV